MTDIITQYGPLIASFFAGYSFRLIQVSVRTKAVTITTTADKTTQTGNRVGGDMAGGDINKDGRK